MRTIFTAVLALALAACGQGSTDTENPEAPAALAAANTAVDFGDDSSRWANDNECDDKRFIGAGMTATPLLDEDIGHDATDCRTAFEAGNLQLRDAAGAAPQALAAAPAGGAVDFGDDSSRWANDNECDDKRFTGAGMTATPLLDEDIGHDATDCRTAYEAGRLQLAGGGAPAAAAQSK